MSPGPENTSEHDNPGPSERKEVRKDGKDPDRGTASEHEANPTPPEVDATTSEDVHDSPQLPPEGHRGTTNSP
ncbi:hypothetical protein [Nocardioides alcanivorans]|uniref:hypothetical protein n=1 Tax=Nocardioides alcanivorans TaxID=2897352 RepID=UPI001F3958F2|nr:hypothetical protein [Nocardioides alcanivorans]